MRLSSRMEGRPGCSVAIFAPIIARWLSSRWRRARFAAITLRLALPRAVLGRLRVRAMRESRKLEALIQEILEGAAT